MSTQPTPEPTDEPVWTPVAHHGDHRPPLPHAVKFGGLALLAVLLVLAVVAGIGLGGGFSPKTPEASASPTPAFSMELPIQVGDFVRGDASASQGPAPENQEIVRADYSDGVNRVVVLLTFPERDIEQFLTDAGVDTSELQGEGAGDGIHCGRSEDTGRQACALVEDSTGLLVLSLTDDEMDVHEAVSQFHEALAKS